MKDNYPWLLATILWCTLIFLQSNKPAVKSDGQSMSIVAVANHWISMVVGKEVAPVTNNMVRSTAHFIEYLILGFLLTKSFASGTSLRYAFLYALIACILYAASDEIHQHFVPGRTMRFTDVLLDSAGVVCGVLIVWGSGRRRAALKGQSERKIEF